MTRSQVDGPATAVGTPVRPQWLRVTTPMAGLRMAGQGMEFAGWALLARQLGTTGFGGLSVAFLVARYAGLVADWGAAMRGSRDVAGGSRGVNALIRQRAGTGVALGAVFVAGTLLLGERGLAPIALTILAKGVSRDWIALGRERGVISGLPAMLQGALILGLAITARSTATAALIIGVAYIVAALLSMILNDVPASTVGTARHANAWMLVAVLADQVSTSADTLFLAVLRSTAVAGVYAAVYRIPSAWVTALGLMVAGLVPLAARAQRERPAHLIDLTARARRAAVVGAVVLLAIAPLSYVLVPFVFGHAYDAGRLPLLILLFATAITTLGAPLQPVFLATGRDRDIARIALTGAAVSLCGYLALIPPMGATGAALATVAGQAAITVLLYRPLPSMLRGLAR